MKFIVCVKQVASIYIKNGYDIKTKDIVSDSLVYVLNPYDEIAVEEAIRQADRFDDGEVTVISIGPKRTEEALRWSLAMGATQAVHVVQEINERLDPWTTAAVLAGIIKEMDYYALFFGKIAIDDNMGQVGTLVAELLNLPVVTSVTNIDLTDTEKARVRRALGRGNQEEVVCAMPAVFTVEKTLNHPRYPTFPDRKAAKKKSVQEIALEVPTAHPAGTEMEMVRLGPPKLKPKKMLAPDSNMSEADRMKFVMMGGMDQKKGGAVGGDPKQIVTSIVEFLEEKKIIGS